MPKRHVPIWLKITVGGFAVLFVLSALLGGSPAPANVAHDTTMSPTATSAPPVRYTATGIAGTTVKLTDTGGKQLTVRAAGIELPLEDNCYGTESAQWASNFLTGKEVTAKMLDTPDGTLAVIAFPDGTNFSMAALRYGNAKYVADAFAATYGPALQAAESSAKTEKAGLWGPPCDGQIDAPAQASSTLPPASGAPPTGVAPPNTTVAPPPAPPAAPPTTRTTCRPPQDHHRGKPCENQ
ncbi:thermonuclease family protein [Amycolatopsis sp. GM8]|uniref:thermonuclease family protein n=1 Tax=Amycolatopsis sp. GM8 TaxID=2896530 RepID=UPI001F46090E|nr:thermonuclease family protein [Amycolatopsis sp. GM8]